MDFFKLNHHLMVINLYPVKASFVLGIHSNFLLLKWHVPSKRPGLALNFGKIKSKHVPLSQPNSQMGWREKIRPKHNTLHVLIVFKTEIKLEWNPNSFLFHIFFLYSSFFFLLSPFQLLVCYFIVSFLDRQACAWLINWYFNSIFGEQTCTCISILTINLCACTINLLNLIY